MSRPRRPHHLRSLVLAVLVAALAAGSFPMSAVVAVAASGPASPTSRAGSSTRTRTRTRPRATRATPARPRREPGREPSPRPPGRRGRHGRHGGPAPLDRVRGGDGPRGRPARVRARRARRGGLQAARRGSLAGGWPRAERPSGGPRDGPPDGREPAGDRLGGRGPTVLELGSPPSRAPLLGRAPRPPNPGRRRIPRPARSGHRTGPRHRPGDRLADHGARRRPELPPRGPRPARSMLPRASPSSPRRVSRTPSRNPPPTFDLAAASGLTRQVFGFLPYWELSGASTKLNYDVLSTIAYFSVGADSKGNLRKKNSDGTTTTGWGGWTSSSLTSVINSAHCARHARRADAERVRLDHLAGVRPEGPPGLLDRAPQLRQAGRRRRPRPRRRRDQPRLRAPGEHLLGRVRGAAQDGPRRSSTRSAPATS